jgi:uncharacterized membrane protein YgcG
MTQRRSPRPTPTMLVLTAGACAGLVWFVHLAVSYALVPTACHRQSALPLLGATAVGVAVGVGSIVVTLRTRAASPDEAGNESSRESRTDRIRSMWQLGRGGDGGGGAGGAGGGGGGGGGGGSRATPDRVVGLGLALGAYFTFVMLLAGLIPILMDPCT